MRKNLRLLSIVVATIAVASVFTTTLGAGIVIVTTTKSPLLFERMDMCGNCTHHGCHNNSNMTTIVGILLHEGGNFKIGTTIVNFGCYNYLNTTISPSDFDGDGTIETILNELLGLVGTSITVQGFLSCHGTRLNVYYLNGIQIRNPPC